MIKERLFGQEGKVIEFYGKNFSIMLFNNCTPKIVIKKDGKEVDCIDFGLDYATEDSLRHLGNAIEEMRIYAKRKLPTSKVEVERKEDNDFKIYGENNIIGG